MKKLGAVFLLCTSAFAAGSVQQSITTLGASGLMMVSFNWTGDSSTGTIPNTAAQLSNCCQGYGIVQVETIPGSPSPTSGYNVQIQDAAGVDMLGGAASGLSATAAQSFTVGPANVVGTFSLVISGQSVASAKGIVYVFLRAPSVAMILNQRVSPAWAASSSKLSWAKQQFTGWIPPFDYEGLSILGNNHNYRTNTNTTRGTSVSTGSLALFGWTTPTNVQCISCAAGNEEEVVNISLLHSNSIVAGVAAKMWANPGVDNYNGVWGFGVQISNNGHANATSTTGLFGGEINIGVDNSATDQATPFANGKQVIGLALTESSTATTNRATAAIGINSANVQNWHNGIWIQANAALPASMDTGIMLKGPISVPIDLRNANTQTQNGSVVLPNGTFGGISGNDSGAIARKLLYVPTSTSITVLQSAGGGVQINSLAGAPNAVFPDSGGIQTAPTNFSSAPACASGVEGLQWAVKDSTTVTWGATVTGAGANHILMYCDGTNWTVAAK